MPASCLSVWVCTLLTLPSMADLCFNAGDKPFKGFPPDLCWLRPGGVAHPPTRHGRRQHRPFHRHFSDSGASIAPQWPLNPCLTYRLLMRHPVRSSPVLLQSRDSNWIKQSSYIINPETNLLFLLQLPERPGYRLRDCHREPQVSPVPTPTNYNLVHPPTFSTFMTLTWPFCILWL